MRRRDFLAGSAAGAAGLLTLRTAVAQESSNVAKATFVYAYPLVLMDLTHRAMAGSGGADQPASFNRFFHYRQLPSEQFTVIVCPVPDALHSSAWLNVKQEPMVISTPAMGGRFCTGSFFHAWHEVIGRIGSNANRGKGNDYLVTGPGWMGAVPKGLVQIASPTNTVWAPIWISVENAEDLPAAVALQSQFRVTPLKDWKPPTPPASGGGFKAMLGSLMQKIGGPQPAAPAIKPGGSGSNEAMPAAGVTPANVAEGGQPPATAPVATAPMTPVLGPDGVPIGPQAGTPAPAEGMPMDVPSDGGAVNAGAMGTSPNAELFKMDASTFYTRACELMVDNPPLEADAQLVAKMAKLGLTPGAKIELKSQSRGNQIALTGGVKNSGQKIYSTKGGLKIISGNRWETAIDAGEYGTNYDKRAHAALMYFGASSPEDVLCPRTTKDGTGKPLQGSNKYTLTFAGAQMPPVSKSWSIAAYKAPMMELGATSSPGKHGVSSHAPLVKNADGGVTIYIQKESPGAEKEPNWLPTPEGAIELVLRLCGPKPEVASLGWKPPAVAKV